jgi:ribosome-associated protein
MTCFFTEKRSDEESRAHPSATATVGVSKMIACERGISFMTLEKRVTAASPGEPIPPSMGQPTPATSRTHLKGASQPTMSARDRAILAARIADDNRGRDVVVLDMTSLVPWVDYLVICTGSSRRQLCAIADDVEKHLLEVGDRKIGTEGYEKGDWIVVDFADVILHAFSDEKRGYYELEHLWGDAKPVEWQRPTEPA